LADISCDSDGKVDLFVDKRDIKKTLELHELREGEPYYLGVFLVGAYQEVLGDLHNLLGDTHAVHVSVDEQGRYSIERGGRGRHRQEVLGYVQFDVEDLEKAMRRDVERAVRENRMGVAEGQSLLKFYERGDRRGTRTWSDERRALATRRHRSSHRVQPYEKRSSSMCRKPSCSSGSRRRSAPGRSVK